MSNDAPAKTQTARKPYCTPRLVEYGDIRAVTQITGRYNKNDGGSGKTKTG